MVSDSVAAAQFYKRIFAATEVNRHPADGSGPILHLHLYINGASVMLMDPMPQHGYPLVAPQAFTLHLQVDDAQAWWDRATAADVEITMPLAVQFWGDRHGQFRDPFGVHWSIGGAP